MDRGKESERMLLEFREVKHLDTYLLHSGVLQLLEHQETQPYLYCQPRQSQVFLLLSLRALNKVTELVELDNLIKQKKRGFNSYLETV